MRASTWFVIAAASFGLGYLTTLHSAERFDQRVRTDFFRGFQGDAAALDRGLKSCEEVLKTNPNDAEAMVWHGSGTYFLAGKAFRDGDREKATELARKALSEMDRAVSLEPGNLAVRIPRGATLLTATRHMQPDHARPLREKALGDYQTALDRQQGSLDSRSEHARGELLSGLAELYLSTGQPDKAAPYLKRLVDTLPGTTYAHRAQEWKASGEATNPQCIGCHVE